MEQVEIEKVEIEQVEIEQVEMKREDMIKGLNKMHNKVEKLIKRQNILLFFVVGMITGFISSLVFNIF